MEVVSVGEGGTTVRRNRRLIVGRTTIHGRTFVVPPPIDLGSFLALVLYALGGDASSGLRDGDSYATRDVGGRAPDDFLKALAVICVTEAENIVRRHVARGYRETTLKDRGPRGRPLWVPDFGRHPSEGITCRSHEMTSNVLCNRLVSAGLHAAEAILEGTRVAERASNQRFIWETLAEHTVVTREDFARQRRHVTRLTSHYDRALAVAEVLVLGTISTQVFSGDEAIVPHFEFSLPVLFEKALVRLLIEAVGSRNCEVRFKEGDRDALVAGDRRTTYRKVEPDITLWRDGVPIAVVDAKFKPRYMEANETGYVSADNRVSPDDIYQLFFYQSRLQIAHGLKKPPRAWIVVPANGEAPGPNAAWRNVCWASDDLGESIGLTLESVDLRVLAECARSGVCGSVVKAAAPRLVDQILDLLDGA